MILALQFLFRAAGGVLALLLLSAACAGAPPGTGGPPAGHVVLVSIDALRPEFYLDAAYPAPTLRALAARGAYACAMEPVFPSVTYPDHTSIVTGVRPTAHGVPFNTVFDPTATSASWYEEASALKATPLWEWARAAGLKTASVSWPVTAGASIDLLLAERNYYARRDALDALTASATPGLFDLTRVAPDETMFRDIVRWDTFLAATAAALIREARPNLLLLHLVQADYFQHRGGRDGADVKPAVARLDVHIAELLGALDTAGLSERTVVIVTGDHGFQDYEQAVSPNEVLARAGLRGCPALGDGWRATAHVSGAAAGVFVSTASGADGTVGAADGTVGAADGTVASPARTVASPAPTAASAPTAPTVASAPPEDAARRAERALRDAGEGRYTIVTRAELDRLGAMPGAAFALEAAPGWTLDGSCGRGLTRQTFGGTHGFLPSRPPMATGFIAAGPGIRPGVAIERARLIDVAPTIARLLGVSTPAVEGRVLDEILK